MEVQTFHVIDLNENEPLRIAFEALAEARRLRGSRIAIPARRSRLRALCPWMFIRPRVTVGYGRNGKPIMADAEAVLADPRVRHLDDLANVVAGWNRGISLLFEVRENKNPGEDEGFDPAWSRHLCQDAESYYLAILHVTDRLSQLVAGHRSLGTRAGRKADRFDLRRAEDYRQSISHMMAQTLSRAPAPSHSEEREA
jgi:hypothetical protein